MGVRYGYEINRYGHLICTYKPQLIFLYMMKMKKLKMTMILTTKKA